MIRCPIYHGCPLKIKETTRARTQDGRIYRRTQRLRRLVMEVVVHRVIWSLPVTGLLLICLGGTQDVIKTLHRPRVLALICLSAALISVNWLIYIWAVVNDHTLEAALGYYISPIFNVLVGATFLHERLNRPQWLAVSLTFAAVALLTVNAGGVPFIALALPVTFGCYSLLRKALPIGAAQGFMLEVMILFLPALGAEIFFIIQGTSSFWQVQTADPLLLLAAGPITAIPLILFTQGARLLSFITLGLMQYSVPTALFLTAIFIFNEPFSLIQLLAFALIWAGLALYSFASIASAHENPARVKRDRDER